MRVTLTIHLHLVTRARQNETLSAGSLCMALLTGKFACNKERTKVWNKHTNSRSTFTFFRFNTFCEYGWFGNINFIECGKYSTQMYEHSV
jgi:hypothetical protein